MKPRNRLVMVLMTMAILWSFLLGAPVLAGEQEQQANFATPVLVVNTSFLNVRTGPGVEYSVLVIVVGGTELPVLGVANDQVWYQVATDGGVGWVNVSFTLPRGDFSNVPLVEAGEVGAPNLGQGGGALPSGTIGSGRSVRGYSLIGRDLHAQPSFESLILSRAVPNDPNTVYPLLGTTTGDDGAIWFLVEVPGVGTGWTDTVELRPLECGGDQVGVIVRSAPITFDGIANRDPFLLEIGTEGYLGPIGGASNELIQFELADGTVGFVPVDAVENRSDDVVSVCDGVSAAALGQGGGGTTNVQPAATGVSGNHVVVNTGNLNIRSGPSAGFSIVATVPGGTELAVIGRAPDNVWFLVEGSFGQGWLNSQFTLFRGAYNTVPVIDDATISSTAASLGQGGGTVPVGASGVASGLHVQGASPIGRDMHAQPSYDSLIVSRAVPNDPNTVYPLLGTTQVDGTIWYLLNIPNVGQGWMDAVYLRPLECGSDQVGVVVSSAPISFEGFANRDSFLLDVGTEGFIVGVRNAFFIFELVDGTVGLVPRDAVENRSDEVVSVCQGVSTVVAGSGGGATIQGSTAPAPAVSGNYVVVNTGNLNIRSGPAAGFSIVATVPGGTELAVVGRASDGVWYLVQGSFGQGWLNSQYVLFRGNYSTVPVVDLSGN